MGVVLPGDDHGVWQIDIWISQEAPRYRVISVQYAGCNSSAGGCSLSAWVGGCAGGGGLLTMV